MTRTLLIITGAALVLCLACMAGAAALGGRDLARNGWAWTIQEGDGDHIRFQRVNGAAQPGPQATRNLAWTGQDALTIDNALKVAFIQGDQAGVVISGPQDIIDRVGVEGGRIFLKDGADRVTFGLRRDGFEAWADTEMIRITVTAPAVRRFAVNGSGELDIRNYDQDTMEIDISGSAEVTGAGKARRLDLSISGSGTADLSNLALVDAEIDIAGSGGAKVGPTGRADISISGSGDVDLTRRPASVTRSISGSGAINESF
ncbi:MAG: DUF2807 domain-containing protein [Brevundimonas sp.]|uniref:GIN domain-containing protein n=1 Tax=Brevundimonas sp. TaxID=1871086 RepID=UPI0025C62D7B|nr:DUF2807 domain-containing protein [Brevundimonas sp.]MBX3478105.1 DUF2807 domain-containing protein [Brevundimonas sp.]